MYSNVTKQTALSVDLVKVCRYCVNIVNVFPHTREVDDQPFPQVNAYFMYCPYKIMHRWQYIFTQENVFLHESVCHIYTRTQIDRSKKISKAMKQKLNTLSSVT